MTQPDKLMVDEVARLKRVAESDYGNNEELLRAVDIIEDTMRENERLREALGKNRCKSIFIEHWCNMPGCEKCASGAVKGGRCTLQVGHIGDCQYEGYPNKDSV